MGTNGRWYVGLIAIAVTGILFTLLALKMRVRSNSAIPSTQPIERTETGSTSKRPLSLAEAKGLRFPLPATATNIQFAEYHDFIAYEFVVRFEASPADCLAMVPKAVEAFHSSLMTPDALAELSQIHALTTERDHIRHVGAFPVPWFDPENIINGVEAGKRDSHAPKIWIDTARGVFYFQYTD